MSRKDTGPRLGRGLAALMGTAPTALDDAPAAPRPIPVELLSPGPFQPRGPIDPAALAELADSIRARGILQPLLARLAAGGVTEVILALGATVDGATTAHWLTEKLRPFGVTLTRLAQGVPIGGALDVLDDGTLATALKARRPF